jgi:hypothetical protein
LWIFPGNGKSGKADNGGREGGGGVEKTGKALKDEEA